MVDHAAPGHAPYPLEDIIGNYGYHGEGNVSNDGEPQAI